MSARYQLYLDDVRDPKPGPWMVVRDFDSAIGICEKMGCPSYISFDHDLGDGPSGFDFASWLVERDLDEPGFIPRHFEYNVHSANVVGRANIEGLLDGYLRQRALGRPEQGQRQTESRSRSS